jgi:hypothetical protein
MMFSWPLTSKPEVSNAIKDFEARIKRHTGASICKIRIDNERAIINLPFQRDSAILFGSSAAYGCGRYKPTDLVIKSGRIGTLPENQAFLPIISSTLTL